MCFIPLFPAWFAYLRLVLSHSDSTRVYASGLLEKVLTVNPSQRQSAGRAGHTTVQGFPLFPLFGRNETTALTSMVVTPRVVTPEVVLGNRFQQQSVLKSGWAPCSATPEPFRETPKVESDAFGWPFTRDPGETPSAIRELCQARSVCHGNPARMRWILLTRGEQEECIEVIQSLKGGGQWGED